MDSSRMRKCCCVESFEQSSATSRAGRRNHSMMTRLSCHGWWSMPDVSCPGVRRIVTGRHHFRYLHGRETDIGIRPVRREGAGKKNQHRSDEQDEPQISMRSLTRNAKKTVQCVSSGMQTVCSELAKSGAWNLRTDGTLKAVNSVFGVPWRVTHGKVDSGQTRSSSGPHSDPSVALRGCTSTLGENHQARRQRVRELTIGCPGCNAIRDNKRAQAHSDSCRMRIDERLRTTPHEAERLDRSNEVINEALAEEVRREEQKRRMK